MKILTIILIFNFCNTDLLIGQLFVKAKRINKIGNEKSKITEQVENNNLVLFSDKIAIIPATKNFSKYKAEIEAFVEALNESKLYGVIICVSSKRQSTRLVRSYAIKLKKHIQVNYKIDSERLIIKCGTGAINAHIGLYVSNLPS